MSVDKQQLWSFHGGLHLPGHKAMSTQQPIGDVFIPSKLVLPLQQHIGEMSEAIVSAGEHVLKGQLLAKSGGYISVPLHAPTSGTVIEISKQVVPHPSGLSSSCIILKPDGKDQWCELDTHQRYQDMDPSALRNRLRDAGIVGLGGAGFPSFIKLNPGARTAIDELIINAAECEPYITCDDSLMRESAEHIVQGIEIMQHALQAKRCLIGIEDNKPEACSAMQQAVERAGNASIRVVPIPTLYPAGGEKQIIKVLTGKETPSQGLPVDVGIVCHNVATALAINNAINNGLPLISRVITLTGSGVNTPGNHEVLIGTPINEWIEHCGGYHDNVSQLIMGGPMMGFNLGDDHVPVIKTTNCILALTEDEFHRNKQATMPCIRCGACMDVCPAQLLPQQLYWQAFARDFDKIQDYNLFDCIECGCCSYVCPSQIPLVQYYRFAKTEIWAQERDKQHSDKARQRHEFRLQRLEADKKEKAENRRKKLAALNASKGKTENQDGKKAEIEAALARVRQKQSLKQSEPQNTDNLTAEQQSKIDEIDARREQTTDNKGPSN